MGERADQDARVARETAAHIHTIVIEQNRRISALERHVKDIKYGVILLIVIAIIFSYQFHNQ